MARQEKLDKLLREYIEGDEWDERSSVNVYVAPPMQRKTSWPPSPGQKKAAIWGTIVTLVLALAEAIRRLIVE